MTQNTLRSEPEKIVQKHQHNSSKRELGGGLQMAMMFIQIRFESQTRIDFTNESRAEIEKEIEWHVIMRVQFGWLFRDDYANDVVFADKSRKTRLRAWDSSGGGVGDDRYVTTVGQ